MPDVEGLDSGAPVDCEFCEQTNCNFGAAINKAELFHPDCLQCNDAFQKYPTYLCDFCRHLSLRHYIICNKEKENSGMVNHGPIGKNFDEKCAMCQFIKRNTLQAGKMEYKFSEKDLIEGNYSVHRHKDGIIITFTRPDLSGSGLGSFIQCAYLQASWEDDDFNQLDTELNNEDNQTKLKGYGARDGCITPTKVEEFVNFETVQGWLLQSDKNKVSLDASEVDPLGLASVEQLKMIDTSENCVVEAHTTRFLATYGGTNPRTKPASLRKIGKN